MAEYNKYALLIGCPLWNLGGVDTDLDVMEVILKNLGFKTTRLCPATKQQIVKTWHDHIERLSAKDAIVVYYTGHGGMVEMEADVKTEVPYRRLQYLLPMDFVETTVDEWKGITDIELSKLLRCTTDKTKNTTIILDCCHAARMARFPGTVKTLNPNEYREVHKHIKMMFARGDFEDSDFHYERNPDAIVVVASAATESAYEQLFNGVQRSVLTEALETVLRLQTDKQVEISWRTAMLRIRDRMKITCPQQFPQVEGDDLRLVFSLERTTSPDMFPVSFVEPNLILEAGELHGVRKGDRYALLSSEIEDMNSESVFNEVVVSDVGPVMSRVSYIDQSHLPPQRSIGRMKALLKKRALVTFLVVLDFPDPPDILRRYISESNFVRIAAYEESSPLATIREVDGQLLIVVVEGIRERVIRQWRVSGGVIDGNCAIKCVTELESLARSRHLLTLEAGHHQTDIAQSIHTELGLVRGDIREPSGETFVVTEGEKIYIDIVNTGQSTVYISIFDVCGGSARLLSTSSPSGYKLETNRTYTFGKKDFLGKFVGADTEWPQAVPRQTSRILETVVLIITDHQIDLRSLETYTGNTRGAETASNLSGLIESISTGATRNLSRETQDYIQFSVQRYSFELVCSRPSF